MLQSAKNLWLQLRDAEPGDRFGRMYREYAEHDSEWIRTALMFVALACFTIGVSFIFVQGPALVPFALAGLIVATQSCWLARQFDTTELALRFVYREWRRLRSKARAAKRRAVAPAPAAPRRLTAG